MSRRKVIYEIQKLERLGIIAVDRVPRQASTFILLDTSAPHAPALVHHMHQPSAQDAPEQSPINKITHRGMNKSKSSEKKDYRPAEYADVILG